MTQLDRLEAIYATHNHLELSTSRNIWHVIEAVPDLIRVARAAKTFLEDGTDLDGERLEKALAPLYREVEP